MILNSSIAIVLHQYKEEHISEEEAIQLINNMYSTTYYPVYYPPQTWPNYKQYEVTCTNGYNKVPEV